MLRKTIIAISLIFALQPAYAENFFDTIGKNLQKAFTPSKFVCTKYEKQEYETLVLKPGFKLPFTEVNPKQKVCDKWADDEDSAVGKKCIHYTYVNSSAEEESRMYQKVKRIRTVCVDGYSTR